MKLQLGKTDAAINFNKSNTRLKMLFPEILLKKFNLFCLIFFN